MRRRARLFDASSHYRQGGPEERIIAALAELNGVEPPETKDVCACLNVGIGRDVCGRRRDMTLNVDEYMYQPRGEGRAHASVFTESRASTSSRSRCLNLASRR